MLPATSQTDSLPLVQARLRLRHNMDRNPPMWSIDASLRVGSPAGFATKRRASTGILAHISARASRYIAC
jgi:hypothetical protein